MDFANTIVVEFLFRKKVDPLASHNCLAFQSKSKVKIFLFDSHIRGLLLHNRKKDETMFQGGRAAPPSL